MKFIEDYRDKYKGKEIWVIGCGPSLDNYPDDFFQDKIIIALNYSIFIFPDLASNPDHYAHAGDTCLGVLFKLYRPDLFKKCIFLYPLFGTANSEWLGEYQNDPVYMRFHNIYGTKERFESVAKCIMERKTCSYIVEGTCLHSAIEAAIVLGAKKVSLVGCETIAQKYKVHAQRRGMWLLYKETPGYEYPLAEQTFNPNSRFANGTRWLAEAFQPYGIEIQRYYYGKGYEKVI